MIILEKQYLKSQEGMEQAFTYYFENVKNNCDGTFNALIGARLEACSYEERTVTMAADAKNWMLNPNGSLHGGITASLLDVTMGLICRYCSGGGMTPTVSMSVEYLRPGPVDRTILVRARLTHRGFSVCHAVAEAWVPGEEDKPFATSSGAYYVTKRED